MLLLLQLVVMMMLLVVVVVVVLFLNKNGSAVLGDLNVSKIAKLGMMQTQTGTPYYASPEVWQDRTLSDADARE